MTQSITPTPHSKLRTAPEGNITLRLTVFSGQPSFPTVSRTLPDEELAPGEFRQLSAILQATGLGLTNGYVRVERVAGVAPYYAYAVINDQASSDGSFIAPVPEGVLPRPNGLTIPVIVESGSFSSELALTNASAIAKTLRVSLVADGIQAPDSTAAVNVTLRSQEQLLFRTWFNGCANAAPQDWNRVLSLTWGHCSSQSSMAIQAESMLPSEL